MLVLAYMQCLLYLQYLQYLCTYILLLCDMPCVCLFVAHESNDPFVMHVTLATHLYGTNV